MVKSKIAELVGGRRYARVRPAMGLILMGGLTQPDIGISDAFSVTGPSEDEPVQPQPANSRVRARRRVGLHYIERSTSVASALFAHVLRFDAATIRHASPSGSTQITVRAIMRSPFVLVPSCGTTGRLSSNHRCDPGEEGAQPPNGLRRPPQVDNAVAPIVCDRSGDDRHRRCRATSNLGL